MSKFEYGFSLTLINNDYYELKFLDIPNLTVTAPTIAKIFEQAQSCLDDYLYDRIKKSAKFPLPKQKAPKDKRLSPSESVVMALSFINA